MTQNSSTLHWTIQVKWTTHFIISRVNRNKISRVKNCDSSYEKLMCVPFLSSNTLSASRVCKEDFSLQLWLSPIYFTLISVLAPINFSFFLGRETHLSNSIISLYGYQSLPILIRFHILVLNPRTTITNKKEKKISWCPKKHQSTQIFVQTFQIYKLGLLLLFILIYYIYDNCVNRCNLKQEFVRIFMKIKMKMIYWGEDVYSILLV